MVPGAVPPMTVVRSALAGVPCIDTAVRGVRGNGRGCSKGLRAVDDGAVAGQLVRGLVDAAQPPRNEDESCSAEKEGGANRCEHFWWTCKR